MLCSGEKDGQPLSIHEKDIENIEALSFLNVFPTCQNHFGTARGRKVKNSTYCCQPITDAREPVTCCIGSAHCSTCSWLT